MRILIITTLALIQTAALSGCASTGRSAQKASAASQGGAGDRCSGLRDELAGHFKKLKGTASTRAWSAGSVPVSLQTLQFQSPARFQRRDRTTLSGKKWSAKNCADSIQGTIVMDGVEMNSTSGHTAEGCAESPRLDWKNSSGVSQRHKLPFSSTNVDSLSCGARFLVFGLSTDSTLDAAELALGIWDLDRAEAILVRSSEIQAMLAQSPDVASNNAIVALRAGGKTLALSPSSRKWNYLVPGSEDSSVEKTAQDSMLKGVPPKKQ